MKRYLIFAIAVAMVTGAYTFYYFRQQPDIPEKVHISFLETFPSEKYPKWKQEGNLYKAAYKISGRERTSLFNAEGKLLRYVEEIEKRHVPEAVLQALEEQFPGSEMEEAFRLHEQGRLSYLLELEQGNRGLKVQVDSNGKLLNRQITTAPTGGLVQQAAAAGNTPEAAAAASASLGKPVGTWELPPALREVSGISLLPDGQMACVQDEAGVVFIYDLNKKATVREIQFAGNGDYEGLEVVGNAIYVLRSDGALFEISDYTAATPAVTLHQSKNALRQDAEGLAYDKASDRLLIVSKGADKNLPGARGIYAFSVTDKNFQEAPAITVPLGQQALGSSSGKKHKSEDRLLPSSLTVHPLTGELYLLDAKNYQLVVLNQQGQVQKKANFSKDQFRQAEGLCFGPNGEMFISSEGKKTGHGILAKFSTGL